MDYKGYAWMLWHDLTWFESTQLTDLAGLFLLRELSNKFDMLKGGLYWDDALLTVEKCSCWKLDLVGKNYINFKKDMACPLHAEINFLNTNLNLISATQEPYIRPNSILGHINANSNH